MALHDVIRTIAGRVAARARSSDRLDADAIHDMRKDLKRARSALRLMRDALPEDEYRAESALLRDAARPLGALRDATVLLGVVNDLLATKAGQRSARRLAALRDTLRKETATLARGMQTGGRRKALARPLEDALAQLERWHLPRDLRPAVAHGLERLYRKARKAAHAARDEGSDAALHEARKRARDLANALQLLGAGKGAGKAAKPAAAFAERLGDDHDLALLLARLAGTRDAAALEAKVQRRRRKLQRKAWQRARKAYRRKPGHFAERFAGA